VITVADVIICDARKAQKLVDDWRANKIGGVICVASNLGPACSRWPRECPHCLSRPMIYDPSLPRLHTPALDEQTPTSEWFDDVLRFYDRARAQGNIIVHCHAGQNRSVGTAGVILVRRHGATPDQAFERCGAPTHAAWRDAVYRAAR
jgi:hypothetical protein